MGRPRGHKLSEETKQKIGQSMTGHKVSIMTRLKLSHAFWKDGGRAKYTRKLARRRKVKLEARFDSFGGELNYLIVEQAKDDKRNQIKFNPGLWAKEDEAYGKQDYE
jgi:hypothetical protein